MSYRICSHEEPTAENLNSKTNKLFVSLNTSIDSIPRAESILHAPPNLIRMELLITSNFNISAQNRYNF